MPKEDKATWKANYFSKIIKLLDEYPRCFIVGADNVGSKQMQQIRMSLRGKAVVLMGKNTMMRKAIRGHLESIPTLEKLLSHIKGNVGFVFTKEDLAEIRDLLLKNKVPAAARAGAIAPCDVMVPAQNTGLGPEKTSFFQALGITTKISRGTIEILSNVQLIKMSERVGASEATLLNMLNISPFTFGLLIQQVYDSGSIYSPEVLDITEADLHARFLECWQMDLQINIPTVGLHTHRCIALAAKHRSDRILYLDYTAQRGFGTLPAFVWKSVIPLWPQSHTLSSTDTSACWLWPWKRTTPSHWLKSA
uniref:Large ribosomal subunit protein uL10 n=1 Tax=Eptatretus burgeri TaxID=7764 RepID=A0A8C4NAK2_EPTBU